MRWMRERRQRQTKETRRRNGKGFGEALLALEDTGILTQDADPGGTTLVDACDGFNKLIHLLILWKVRHR